MPLLINTASQTARTAGGGRRAGHILTALVVALRTHATRRELVELPGHLLADIGIDRSAALAEAARLPWDVTPAPRARNPTGIWTTLRNKVEQIRARDIMLSAEPNQVSWGG